MSRFLQLPISVMLHKLYQAYNDPFDGLQGSGAFAPRWHMILCVRIDSGEVLQVHSQSRQVSRVARALQGNDQFLHRLHKGLWRLQLVDDALHMRLVGRVTVQQ